MKIYPSRQTIGFSLVELLMVVAVLAILAVNVMPKWQATGLNVNYQALQVLNDIRYAQALSLTTGNLYAWVKLSSNTYSIYNEAQTPIVMPSGNTVVTLDGNTTFGTLTNLPNSYIVFDSTGTPYVTNIAPMTALASTATIPLVSGSVTSTVQINAVTGAGTIS